MAEPEIYANNNGADTASQLGIPQTDPAVEKFPEFEQTKDAFKLQHAWVIKQLAECLKSPVTLIQRREILLDIRESLTLMYGKTAIRYTRRKPEESPESDEDFDLTDETKKELEKLDLAQAKENRSGKR